MKTGKEMSRLAKGLVGLAIGSGLAGITTSAFAGISATKHNLSTSGTGTNHTSTGTAEICVFCHTPHAADVSTAGIPLWNKRLNTGVGTFTTYSSSTMNAVNANDGQGGGAIGSVSLACLSCHDGTQAMDNMLNAPGSGGYASDGGGTGGLTYSWVGNVDASGRLTNATNTLSMLGKDLSNDHPIGMQYCGGGVGNQIPAGTCNDADFIAPTSGSIGGQTVWWVDTGGAGRAKTDMILFNRAFPANGTQGAGNYPSVECASCHDPHTSNALFLRVANTGSAVCLACHSK